MKNPCMYARNNGVPTKWVQPSFVSSARVTNLCGCVRIGVVCVYWGCVCVCIGVDVKNVGVHEGGKERGGMCSMP